MNRSSESEEFGAQIPGSFSHYEVIRMIDSSSTKCVVEAHDTKNNTNVACKIILRSKTSLSNLEQELRIHEFLNHPNIIKIYETIYLPEVIVIVEELCLYDLFAYLKSHPNMNIGVKMSIFRQIARAVDYLHKHDICHLDIKPENILVAEDFTIKLTDFGCSEKNTDPCCYLNYGTLYYSAPEMFLGKILQDRKPSDIWSLGISFFAIIYEQLPWRNGNDEFIINQIINGDLLIPNQRLIKVNEIIKMCCRVLPEERAAIGDIIKFMDRMHIIDLDLLNKDVMTIKVVKTSSRSSKSCRNQSKLLVKPTITVTSIPHERNRASSFKSVNASNAVHLCLNYSNIHASSHLLRNQKYTVLT